MTKVELDAEFECSYLNEMAIKSCLYYTQEADIDIESVFDQSFCDEKLSVFQVASLPKGAPVELEVLAKHDSEVIYKVAYGLDYTQIG